MYPFCIHQLLLEGHVLQHRAGQTQAAFPALGTWCTAPCMAQLGVLHAALPSALIDAWRCLD